MWFQRNCQHYEGVAAKGFDPKNAIDLLNRRHNCPQSLLISIPTYVGTKDFSDNCASHKCIFRVDGNRASDTCIFRVKTRKMHIKKSYVGHVCGKSFPIATFVRRLLLNNPVYFHAKKDRVHLTANSDLERVFRTHALQ